MFSCWISRRFTTVATHFSTTWVSVCSRRSLVEMHSVLWVMNAQRKWQTSWNCMLKRNGGKWKERRDTNEKLLKWRKRRRRYKQLSDTYAKAHKRLHLWKSTAIATQIILFLMWPLVTFLLFVKADHRQEKKKKERRNEWEWIWFHFCKWKKRNNKNSTTTIAVQRANATSSKLRLKLKSTVFMFYQL